MTLLIFIELVQSISNPSQFRSILRHLEHNKSTRIYFCFQANLISSLLINYDFYFYLSLSEWNKASLSVSLEGINLFAIVNSIFHVLDFLGLFMIPFRHGLILLRYFSVDGPLFLSLLLPYQLKLLLEKLLTSIGL